MVALSRDLARKPKDLACVLKSLVFRGEGSEPQPGCKTRFDLRSCSYRCKLSPCLSTHTPMNSITKMVLGVLDGLLIVRLCSGHLLVHWSP